MTLFAYNQCSNQDYEKLEKYFEGLKLDSEKLESGSISWKGTPFKEFPTVVNIDYFPGTILPIKLNTRFDSQGKHIHLEDSYELCDLVLSIYDLTESTRISNALNKSYNVADLIELHYSLEEQYEQMHSL